MTAVAAIHIGIKQLGIEEEDKRDLYERTTGVRSLREMKPAQKDAVLGELNRLGFKKKPAKRKLQGRFAPKLQALWISGWNLGIVKDKKDSALLSFVKRQTGLDHTRFLHHQEDATKAIEALKAWLARDAKVSWEIERWMPEYMKHARYKVVSAQANILANRMPDAQIALSNSILLTACSQLFAHQDLEDLTPADWIKIQRELGKAIRGEVSYA